jgi:hypothetical protein
MEHLHSFTLQFSTSWTENLHRNGLSDVAVLLSHLIALTLHHLISYCEVIPTESSALCLRHMSVVTVLMYWTGD